MAFGKIAIGHNEYIAPLPLIKILEVSIYFAALIKDSSSIAYTLNNLFIHKTASPQR